MNSNYYFLVCVCVKWGGLNRFTLRSAHVRGREKRGVEGGGSFGGGGGGGGAGGGKRKAV